MSRYVIVGFDFDGTLVDSRAAIVSSADAAFKEFSLTPPTREEVLSLMGIPVEKSFPQFHKGVISEEQNTALVKRYREIYREVSKDCLEVYPGIIEILRALRAGNVRVGIVTSKSAEAAMENAKQLNFAEYIEVIIGAHEVKNPKPDPEPLRMLCRAFGRYPDSSTLVVGDATFDIEMANRAGADSCAVTWGAHSHELLATAKPKFFANTAAELVAIL